MMRARRTLPAGMVPERTQCSSSCCSSLGEGDCHAAMTTARHGLALPPGIGLISAGNDRIGPDSFGPPIALLVYLSQVRLVKSPCGLRG